MHALYIWVNYQISGFTLIYIYIYMSYIMIIDDKYINIIYIYIYIIYIYIYIIYIYIGIYMSYIHHISG